jgi:hypothetical protein
MYHYETVIQGLVKFVDEELVPKMHGLNKWLFGTGAGIVATKAHHVFESIKEIELLHTLELIEEEQINVTCIYKELLRQAQKGDIHIEVPMIGTIKLDHHDVEKIYRYIIED